MVRYCAVYGCLENTKTNKNRRFFRFPADELRCRHWCKAISRMDLKSKGVNTLHTSYFVCELHFADSDCPRKYLKGDAVPTLLLPQLEDSSGTSKYTQTDVNILSCSCKLQISAEIPSTSQSAHTTNFLSEDTPRRKKSESKTLRLLQESITKNSNAKEFNMPLLLNKLINTQKVLQRYSQGNSYNQKYMMFALNIYFTSPVTYRFLSETLCLPNIRTLQRHVAFGISTTFDENVIKFLQSKSRNMSESEKCCIICAGVMSLKSHLHYQINKDKVVGFHEINEKQRKQIANQVFVVMVRGIFSNWKQPLAFCFLSQCKNNEDLNNWLENIILKMIEIGFNVCAFVSDQEPNFINMAKSKSVSPDQPFFYVNSRKIYYIFDVPHLMKSLRNSLINNIFVYHDDDGSEQVSSWDDIEKMYDIEKNKKYKIAFKLTETHMKPNDFEKMQVKYATQVLSRAVAVAICTLVESGKLNEECMGTTKFIELINDLFDILNSSAVSDDCKYKKALYQAKYQTNTLEKAQRILYGLRVINRNNGEDVTNTMKFIEGLLTSIKAISSLATDLKTMGLTHLFTRKLNQDPLENFFVKVRQQVGNSREPTAIQFLAAFKKFFLVKIIRHSKYANRAEELDQLFMSVEEAQSSLRTEEKVSMELLERTLQVGTNDYSFELPKENTVTYICKYLLKKCYDRHRDCEVMKNYIKRNEQVDENNRTDYPFGTLISPPEDFIQYIKELNGICEDHFINSDFYCVGNNIMTKMNETVFNLPCPCFPLEFLKKLFVRFRIFNVMRHNNKNFRNKSLDNKYFSVSHL